MQGNVVLLLCHNKKKPLKNQWEIFPFTLIKRAKALKSPLPQTSNPSHIWTFEDGLIKISTSPQVYMYVADKSFYFSHT